MDAILVAILILNGLGLICTAYLAYQFIMDYLEEKREDREVENE